MPVPIKKLSASRQGGGEFSVLRLMWRHYRWLRAAWAAARRAMGTRKGEQLT